MDVNTLETIDIGEYVEIELVVRICRALGKISREIKTCRIASSLTKCEEAIYKYANVNDPRMPYITQKRCLKEKIVQIEECFDAIVGIYKFNAVFEIDVSVAMSINTQKSPESYDNHETLNGLICDFCDKLGAFLSLIADFKSSFSCASIKVPFDTNYSSPDEKTESLEAVLRIVEKYTDYKTGKRTRLPSFFKKFIKFYEIQVGSKTVCKNHKDTRINMRVKNYLRSKYKNLFPLFFNHSKNQYAF